MSLRLDTELRVQLGRTTATTGPDTEAEDILYGGTFATSPELLGLPFLFCRRSANAVD